MKKHQQQQQQNANSGEVCSFMAQQRHTGPGVKGDGVYVAKRPQDVRTLRQAQAEGQQPQL